MPTGSEVGIAYVTLAVSGQGIVSGLQKEMAGVAGVATSEGNKAGLGMGKALLAGVAVVGGGAALATKALYSIGSTFDDVTDTIRIGTGATGKALDNLVASAKNVGKQTPSAFGDIGTAIADLNTRVGLTGKPLESMATQFLNLSRITETDLSGNIANLTRVFGAWQIKAEDQPAALDKIFRASQSTGIGIDALGKSVVEFGPMLQQMGFGFEESTALISKFEKEGVNISPVLAAMKMGLANLSRAGEDPPKALARITEEIQKAGSTAEANQIALQVFGARAGPEMAQAIRSGRFELGDLLDVISNGSETINAAADDTNDLAESWQIFKNKALVAIEPVASKVFNALSTGMAWIADKGGPALIGFAKTVGEKLKPGLVAVGGLVTDQLVPALVSLYGWFADNIYPILKRLGSFIIGSVIPAFSGMADWIKRNKEWILPLVAAFAAGFVALKAYHGAVSLISAATKAWGVIQAAFNLIMNANPIGVVIALVAALAAGIAYAWTHSETFRNAIYAVWDALKAAGEAVAGAVGAIGDFVEKIGGWFAGLPGTIWDALKGVGSKIAGVFTAAWEAVKKALSWLWDNIYKHYFTWPLLLYDGAKTLWSDYLQKPLREAWEAVKGAATWLWEQIKTFILAWPENAYNNLKALGEWLARPFTEAWNKVWSALQFLWHGEKGAGGIAGFFRGLPKNILSALGDLGDVLYDWVTGAWDKVWDGIQWLGDKIWGGLKWLGGKVKGFFTGGGDDPAAGAGLGDLGTELSEWIKGNVGGTGAGPIPGSAVSGMKSKTSAVWRAVAARFPGVPFLGGQASRPYKSDHTSGNAFDLGGSTAQMNEVARWIAANGSSLGVKYIIHNPLGIWRPSTGWQPYTPSAAVRQFAGASAWHYDHVHVSTYKRGGSVPGYGPQLAELHGGEYVLTQGDTGLMRELISVLRNRSGNTFIIYANDAAGGERAGNAFIQRLTIAGVM